MPDHYPDSSSVPASALVPPQAQPEFTATPGHDVGERANVAVALSDAHVAAGHGDAPAAIQAGSGRSLSYAELSRESTRLAAGLRQLGIEPGDRIAFRSPNAIDLFIVILAAWKAGAVVVPTPAQARAAELRFFLEDTGARALFVFGREDLVADLAAATSGTAVEHVVQFGDRLPAPDTSWWLDLMRDDDLDPALPSDSVAVIWHTGGTTGQPKACYHTHRRMLSGGYASAAATGIRRGELWAAAAPLGHALGLGYHTVFTLLHGATVVLVEDFANPRSLLEAVAKHRIETLTAIAVSWSKMDEVLIEDDSIDISSLRRAYAMWQSASSAQLYDAWMARGVELLNNFGSTAFCSWILVPREGSPVPRASLGRPVPGYRVEAVEVVDGSVRPLPPGTVGRLAVRGPSGLTYWNRPELQRRDVVDGWTLVDDLIRFDEDGNAAYYGRTDFLVSSAGYKIAPVEVEQVLATHEAVGEVAVVGAPDPIRQEVVAAFVVVEEGFAATPELTRELQGLVKERLSPYKYPRRVEYVDSLPRDHVGKLQLRVLKEWASESVESQA